MTDAVAAVGQPLPERLRTYLFDPDMASVWAAIRSRLERNGLQTTGSLTVDVNDVAADRLSGLLGRTVTAGPGRQLRLQDMDSALRRSSAGRGLISILEAMDGRPMIDRSAVRRETATQWAKVLRDLDLSLAKSGLADAGWVPGWIAGLRRTGILTRAGTTAASRSLTHAATALGILAYSSAPLLLAADPVRIESTSWELAVLASQATNDAHGLDDSALSSAVLLRAAAHAYGVSPPESAADRRQLWQALGVATDALSGTVLSWQLRPPGTDRWSTMMRERADLGLVTHLTMHELDHAGPVMFAERSQQISVCENPQVLQAAAHAGCGQPLLCLSGNPATVGRRLLRTLLTAGYPVRYHGDFDWPGIAIAGRIVAAGATAWRMSAVDYRAAATMLDQQHAVPLAGKVLTTAWDPDLARAMCEVGKVVHEESVLDDLLADVMEK